MPYAAARRSKAAGLIWSPERRVATPLVIEHFDVVEAFPHNSILASPLLSKCSRSSLFTVESRSSPSRHCQVVQQLPRRLILQIIP